MPRSLGATTLRILAAVRDGHAYGLDIVANTGVPSGTVYPALGRLSKKGLVESRWEDADIAEADARPRRRYYALTPEGARRLAEGSARIADLAAELDPGLGRSS